MFCCSSSDVEKIGWIATFQLKADGVGVDGVRGGQREIDRWIDGEGNREGGREIDREGAGERYIKLERATEEEMERTTERNGERQRERDRQTERERERERERETGRETERERDRQRETDRDRDREGCTTFVEISRIKRLFMLIKCNMDTLPVLLGG